MSFSQANVLNNICEIVKEAGQIVLSAQRSEEMIDEKAGRANFVTSYDKKVQDFLFDKLARLIPEAVFIGEEEDSRKELSEGYSFIIDPIDGTTNFIKDYKVSSISVGLLKNKKPFMGVVYNPYLDEMFSAEKGKGAFMNGQPIKVSDKSLSEGIVLFGTSPYRAELCNSSFHVAYGLIKNALDVRRSGSAAIDLCSIACGRAELYFELTLSPWDFAAGALIVTEAGGFISSGFGKEISFSTNSPVFAGNALVEKEYFQQFPSNYEMITTMASGLFPSGLKGDLSSGQLSLALITALSNLSAMLYNEIPLINWAGFYLMGEDGKLHLGPFGGQVACVEIALNRGVCGKAASDMETVYVKDVHEFPGHIACDCASASEIVVPIIIDNKLWGVLDIDSPIVGRFGEKDKEALEQMISQIFY